MTCDAPIQAYKSGVINPATGKRPMQFRAVGSFSGVRQMLPCGKCVGCKLDRSREWAVRLLHEKKQHKVSSFVTLTYDQEHLPHVGTLVPTDLQLFHKRLHNRLLDARGYGIRYFGCGEYGDLNKRPHYHSILFGVGFPDKKLYSRNDRGEPIFSSAYLDEVWGMGAAKVGDVTFESAAYVARYCVKKVDGAKRDAGHYAVYDSDGVIHEREPEFAHMSRRPGIGAGYFAKYGSELMTHDSIVIDGREVPSIRYYDKKIEALDPVRMASIKRSRQAKSIWKERQVDRRRVKEVLRLTMLKMKERRL